MGLCGKNLKAKYAPASWLRAEGFNFLDIMEITSITAM